MVYPGDLIRIHQEKTRREDQKDSPKNKQAKIVSNPATELGSKGEHDGCGDELREDNSEKHGGLPIIAELPPYLHTGQLGGPFYIVRMARHHVYHDYEHHNVDRVGTAHRSDSDIGEEGGGRAALMQTGPWLR